MKLIFSFCLILFAIAPAYSHAQPCEQAARDSVVGLVKGLGQDVRVSGIELKSVKGKAETYLVKLHGNGFS